MKRKANAVKYDRLAGGRLYIGNNLFRLLSWQLKRVGDDINDWELLHVSGLLAGFGDTRLVVLLLSESLG
jgi:hypothetical protein